MSAFEPIRIHHHTGDPLGDAVLLGLSRPIGPKHSWGVVRSLFAAFVTFGVMPLLELAGLFRHFRIGEQQQFLHLARWLWKSTDDPQDTDLVIEAEKLQRPTFFTQMTVLTLSAMVVILLMMFGQSRVGWDVALLSSTYFVGSRDALGHLLPYWSDAQTAYFLWVLGLLLASLFLWVGILVHASRVQQFVIRCNRVFKSQGIAGVDVPRMGLPVYPLWIAAGLCLFSAGAVWGIVAMLAAGTQRRYINGISREVRAELAQRVRTLMLIKQGDVVAAMPVYLRRQCVEPLCRASLAGDARFCRRCGTRQPARNGRAA